MSYPFKGDSVNSSINKDTYTDGEPMDLKYPTVDDLARIIREKHGKVHIFVRDLSKAYRQLWMCLASIHLLGYSFDSLLYFDVTLSMGSKSAAFCCQKTTDAVTHIFQQHGFQNVNYLDDLGAAEEDSRADEAFDCLGWILDTIGIRESRLKAKPPAYIVVFLGILFNTVTMTLTITPDRLEELRQLLKEWSQKRSATLRELQSLLGTLNFAASTVRAGRVFVSRLINNLKDYPMDGRRKINGEMKKDIQWWQQFMEEFNRVTIMPPKNWDSPDAIFSTDVCLTAGGGWSQGQAFYAEFSKWLTVRGDVSINELELIMFIVALKVWKSRISNRNILAFCDNEVSVEVVNAGHAKNRFLQACLREICYITACCNAVIKLVHRVKQNQ